jgi:hypothetical protein
MGFAGMHHHDLYLYGLGMLAFILLGAILYCLYKYADRSIVTSFSAAASRRDSRASNYSASVKKQHEVPLVVCNNPDPSKVRLV